MTKRDERIIALHKENLSASEIARRITAEGTRTSSSSVRARMFVLRKKGHDLPPREYVNNGRPRKHDYEAIVDYYKETKNQQKTAKHFNISAKAVSRVLAAHQVEEVKP